MIRRPPRSTRTDTLFPYTTLFRSMHDREPAVKAGDASRSARMFNVRPIASADTPAHVDTGAPGANRPDVYFQEPGTFGMSRPSRGGLAPNLTYLVLRSQAYTTLQLRVAKAVNSTRRIRFSGSQARQLFTVTPNQT